MNANLQSQITIKDWLIKATQQLSEIDINSSKLDAEIILSNAINKNRTYLHAHYDNLIDINIQKIAGDMLLKRISRIPIAYIIGYKEFYGRKFFVNSSTLIPRPESETIIEILKDVFNKKSFSNKRYRNLVDIGTGCGCLGITSKLELPWLNVTLSDIRKKPLIIADLNAKKLSAKVKIIQSDLLDNHLCAPDIIIANLPYVDKRWKRSPETNYEPASALFAKNHGLATINKLIAQSCNILKSGSYLIIEADPTQQAELTKYANSKSFNKVKQTDYVIAFKLKK